MHEVIRRKPGGNVSSRKRRDIKPTASGSSAQAGPVPHTLKFLSTLEDFETLVQAGPLDSLPSIHNLLDEATPLLSAFDDIGPSDAPTSLYGRLQSTILRTLDRSHAQAKVSKEAKRKKKESHSVSVSFRVFSFFRSTESLYQNLVASWKDTKRQEYAEEFTMASNSFNTSDSCCENCQPDACIYSCSDCIGVRFSKECIVSEHRYNPLHRIQVCVARYPFRLHFSPNTKVFRDEHFQPVSLMELGLVVQLNHRQGDCSYSLLQACDFTVYDVNGVHTIKMAYCGCRQDTAISQIFRQRWFPATWKQPRTAFSFGLLKLFHIVNLQSKCNMYDFYRSILRLTNNSGVYHLPVSRVTSHTHGHPADISTIESL
jgi:hypothetical protein